MSCLKFKSSKLNLLSYLVEQKLVSPEQYLDFNKIASNEDIYEFPFYPKQTRLDLKSESYGVRSAKEKRINELLKKVAIEYYNLPIKETDKFFEKVTPKYEDAYYKFNFELLDQVDARRKELGLYNDKLMADALFTSDKFVQESGRNLDLPINNIEVENLQKTVEYSLIKEQEEDLEIKSGQKYIYLNSKDAERFSKILEKSKEFPKEFKVTKLITKYEKIPGKIGTYNSYNQYRDFYYIKSNKNKKSNLYNIIDRDTGEIIAEKVRVIHLTQDSKSKIAESYGLEFKPTKVFNANRSIAFSLYIQKPSKAKYIAQAKKYLYDAIKFLNPEETNLKINLDKIENMLDAFPEEMWEYINTTYSPENSANINASISLKNSIDFNLPKLGLLEEIEKITGISLIGVSFKNYDKSGQIGKKFNVSWGEVVTIDPKIYSAAKLKTAISYYLKNKNYFKPTSERENVRKYAEHAGIKNVEELEELVFGSFENALSNISYNYTKNSDSIELSKWRESIRNYDWQIVELFKKPYDKFNQKAKEKITEKFKDKKLANGVSHLDYFFSGNFNWLNINFNNISGEYYNADMESVSDVGVEYKENMFFVETLYKKPKPGKNFLKESEVFNRLAAIMHEPFHALHALSYGTTEEKALRKAFDDLYKTSFGKEMMLEVFGNAYNGKNISYDVLYKEFTAFTTQLMLYPKTWIKQTDLRSNDIYDFIEKIQTLQDKTYDEIVRTKQKIGTTQYTITEEEEIKLNFLEQLYNYIVSALNKIIPLSKKFFNTIADSKLVEKTVVEDVFGDVEETITKTLKLPEEVIKAKEEFLEKMDELKTAINALMQIDSEAFSSSNISEFFTKQEDSYAQESVDYYREEDFDYFMEMLPSVEEQQNIQAQEVAVIMANRLASQTGLGYQVISAEEASKITSSSSNPWNGEPAFFYEGRVYFVSSGFKLSHVLHEYAHPIVRAIYTENPTLFNNAYRTILNTPEGSEIFNTVSTLYPEYTPDDINFQQEVFVRALEKAAINKVNKIENSTGFKKFLTNILYAIKQLLKKLFGDGVRVSKLSETTTIEELADMLVGENFILTTEIISEKEIVNYLRDNKELYNDLSKVDDNSLNKTVNRYFSAVNNILSRTKNNQNYEDFVKTITSETGSSMIQEIYSNLKKAETLNVDERVKKFKDDLDKREKQIQSFVRATVQTDILTDKVFEKLAEISRMSDTKEVISRTFYYDLALRNWSKIIDESINNLVDSGLKPNSALFTKLTDIKNKIEQSNRLINKIYKKGVGGVLFDVMSDLTENVDQFFERKIELLKEKGASEKEIKKTQAEYQKLKLDRATVDDYLSGMRGDVNILSAYVESFSSSPDPIVSSLGVFFDNAYTEVDSIATTKAKNFYSDLQKALKEAGLSDKNITSLMKEFVYKDKVLYRGKEGTVEEFEKLVFLNNFKGYEAVVDKYEYDIEDAKREGNLDEARRLSKEFRIFQKEFMHNTYVAEFYDKEKIYDSDLGQIAYERKINLLAEISDIDSRIFEDLTEDEAFELKKELWKEYQQLSSEYDANGMKKQGDELEIAKIEKQYREESRKFYEWSEIPGLFEFKLNEFKQDLLDKGLHPESQEFKDAFKEWLLKNTRVVIKPDFYEKKKEIIGKIKKVLAGTSQKLIDDLDISSYWNEILDLTKGFKDDSNQIEALDLGPAKIKKIKELQEKVELAKDKLANYTGLTRLELSNYFELLRKRKAKDITEEEINILDSLSAKKEANGLSQIQQEILKELYSELSDLQTKEASEYYFDTFNSLMSLKPLSEAARAVLADQNFVLNNKNAYLVNDSFFRSSVIDTNPELKKWFYANHLEKEVYDSIEKEKVPFYERLYVWNITKPASADYYEKYNYENINPLTNTSDIQTIYIDGSYRIPNFSYYRKSVKKEYRTKKEVGKTIDNRGNWLPRTLKDGAKDDRYINKDYEKLKNQSPEKFKILQTLTKYLLEFQEGKARSSKLYLDVPRMRKLSSEVLFNKSNTFANKVKSTINSIKSQLTSSTDDFEFGLNYNQSLNLVKADMFDEEISTIPVRGLYRIDTTDVSLNTPYSIVEYMYSLEHQQKLIEINPTVQALQKVVNDPENAIKDTTRVNAYNYVNNNVTSFITKKGKNLRAEAINTMIETRLQGKTRVGLLSQKSSAQKIIDGLQRQASFGMFSMNIFPSAIKNFGGAFANILIEAGGGKYYNGKDLLKAAPKAFKTAMDLSSNIYKIGEKSIEYQLVEYFDPIKGRVQERLGSEFGRSVGSDLIDSVLMFGEGRRRTNGFWTSPRKWLQNEATLNSFFALMNHTKVPQTINGQTNYISYTDAWEKGPDGIIKLKEGISEDWAINGKEFKKVKNATQEVTNNLEGAYSQVDKTQLDRYAIWRLFSSLRRYFTRMFVNRFSSKRYNMRLGNLTEGYYRTFVEMIPKLIMRISQGSFFMTEEEQYVAKKMLTEFAILGMLSFMIAYIFGYDPDDEDRFEKMRNRSGDLLSDDFRLGGWLMNHGLTSTLGTRQEVLTFMNPKEYVNLVYSGGAPTLGPIVDLYKRMGTDGLYLITNDNRAYYKRDVGPYEWQKEGSAKVFADMAYLFGLSGSQVDPIKSVKGYEYQNNR